MTIESSPNDPSPPGSEQSGPLEADHARYSVALHLFCRLVHQGQAPATLKNTSCWVVLLRLHEQYPGTFSSPWALIPASQGGRVPRGSADPWLLGKGWLAHRPQIVTGDDDRRVGS